MIVAVIALAAVALAEAVVIAVRSRPPRALRRPPGGRRVLVPFVGALDPDTASS